MATYVLCDRNCRVLCLRTGLALIGRRTRVFDTIELKTLFSQYFATEQTYIVETASAITTLAPFRQADVESA